MLVFRSENFRRPFALFSKSPHKRRLSHEQLTNGGAEDKDETNSNNKPEQKPERRQKNRYSASLQFSFAIP